MNGIETEALPIGTRLEKYELLQFLGQGGGGITYLAKDSQLERLVVLKEHFPLGYCHRDADTGRVLPTNRDIYERSLQYFCREVRILASLNYDGIVRVHEAFAACNTVFMVMDYVEGATLKSWLETHPTLEKIEQVLYILLDTLEYLNSKEIIHRDIKPGNIIINERELPVLIDFGAAMVGEASRTLTMVGSPSFSAPEQFVGAKNIDTRADIYSLARSFIVVVEEYGIYLPKRVSDSLKKASALDPDARYANIAEWRADLESVSQKAGGAEASEKSGIFTLLGRHAVLLSIVGGAVVLVLLVVGVLNYTETERDFENILPITSEILDEKTALTDLASSHSVLDNRGDVRSSDVQSKEEIVKLSYQTPEDTMPRVATKHLSNGDVKSFSQPSENARPTLKEKNSNEIAKAVQNNENVVSSPKKIHTEEDIKFLSLYDPKRMEFVESRLDPTKLVISKPVNKLTKKEITMLVNEMTTMEEYKKIFPIPEEIELPNTKIGDSKYPAHPLDLVNFAGEFLVDYQKLTDSRERAFLDAVAMCHSRYLNMQAGVISERHKCRRNNLNEHWPNEVGVKSQQLLEEMKIQFVMDFVKIYCAYIEKYFNGKDPREDSLRTLLY